MSLDALDQDWTEIATGCWVRGYAEWNVNVGVVAGDDGLLVVDTRGTAEQGQELRRHIARLDPRPVRWVVNTHQHFDHVRGNIAFDDARIHAHENAAAALADADRPPDTTLSSVAALDLGDRYVEVFYPGRGHTDGDVVIRVPDIDVVFAGDLVEESAPPSLGPDSYPMEWPDTLELVIGVLGEHSSVVPGHGAPVGHPFVLDQRGDLADVANTIGRLRQQGASVEEALQQGEWPWDPSLLADAVRRGYEHLGPQRPGLPLLE
ncbi:MAG TPA: MBL fold metallo-hydrolase [Nocardioidaceae bacterium]|nr:MBL fold metallo-hydrolase [Nocardioidaceae bacterium]